MNDVLVFYSILTNHFKKCFCDEDLIISPRGEREDYFIMCCSNQHHFQYNLGDWYYPIELFIDYNQLITINIYKNIDAGVSGIIGKFNKKNIIEIKIDIEEVIDNFHHVLNYCIKYQELNIFD